VKQHHYRHRLHLLLAVLVEQSLACQVQQTQYRPLSLGQIESGQFPKVVLPL
jgi:hypothetical protein